MLDHLCIRDCVFAGLSLGGMVAQGLAVKRLDQIRALVLSNTATRIGTKENWARLIDATARTGLEARLQTDLDQTFTAAFRAKPEASHWKSILQNARLDAVLGASAAIAGTDFYTTTASLRLPSLIIACADDAITPADMVRELSDLIPGARFHLIRKSGHLPVIEQPEAYAQTVTDFLISIGHV